jgi:hypothetical protein
LISLFKALKEARPALILLNACHSHELAQAIAEVIGCAIGMNAPIVDKLAVKFAPAFYRALAYGSSVQVAFDLAKVEMGFKTKAESQTTEPDTRDAMMKGQQAAQHSAQLEVPQLFLGTGVDATRLILGSPAVTAPKAPAHLSTTRRRALEEEIKGLVETIPIYQEKLNRIRGSLAIQTDEKRIFQLEKEIELEEIALKKIYDKIEKKEQELGQ